MSLEAGARLLHYSITDKIGEGGMGAVYAAEDTRLGRRVALKVLPAELAEDADKLRRFEREARAIAALNHPNVVTLYSVEHSEDTRFLTMELIDGEPLSELIPAGGLQIDRLLELALPVTEAVAAAHARGITHRDLKPTNVMVDTSGHVKVLDFGLAKFVQRQPLTESFSDSDSQMVTELVTGTGTILGTVAYMSPEQAEGKPIDERSDIFSLGIVLYQMITGERPFTGDSPVSILSKILHVSADRLTARRGDLPRQLQRILDACLAKQPGRRYQSVLDLRNALASLREEIAAGPPIPAAAPEQTRPAWINGLALTLAGATLGALAAAAILRPAGVPIPDTGGAARGNWTLSPLVASQEIMPTDPDFSPNGEWVVYAAEVGGERDLWRLPSAGGARQRLTETPEAEVHPAWSPDGRRIAYAVESGGESGIYVMPSSGGNSVQLVNHGSHPAWSPDGTRIAYDWRGSVRVVSVDVVGTWRVLLDGLADDALPVWTRDGRGLILWSGLHADVVRLDADDPSDAVPLQIVPTGNQVVSLSIAGNGRGLVISRGQYGGHKNLWYVPLAPDGGRVTGEPVRLTDSVTDDRSLTISSDGTRIAYVARNVERHLYSLPLDPETGLRAGGMERLTYQAAQNYYPRLSPDGTQLAWTAHHTGAGFVYLRRLDEPDEIKLTDIWDRSVREIGASFAPDGQTVVYSSTVGNSYRLWRVPCAGCVEFGLTEVEAPHGDYLPDISPDGRTVAFHSDRSGSMDLWTVPSTGGRVRQLTSLPGSEEFPIWSPDGQRIAFRSTQGDDADIWTVKADGSELAPRVELDSDETWAAWSPDGSRLYFVSDASGTYEVWMQDGLGHPQQVTRLGSSRGGLPDSSFFTKFAVGQDHLIVPTDAVTGKIWVLERPS